MTVNISKPSINIREKLAELDKPSGIAGEAVLRADSVQEIRDQIGAGRKNLIINGGMQFSQRGTTGTTPSTNNYMVDRFKACRFGGYPNIFNQALVTDAPAGFINSWKLTNNTGHTLTGTNASAVIQSFEGLNVAHLAWGTSAAKPVTLSFWVKSSLTGSFAVAFADAGNAYDIGKLYNIDSANTWEYKTISIAGPTAGTFDVDNTVAFHLAFGFGSTSATRTANLDSWALNANTGSSKVTTAGAGNAMATTNGATWQVTGVQLELGSVATDFEHRSYGEELALCQRYYVKQYGAWSFQGSRWVNEHFCSIPHPVTMRGLPTFTSSGAGAFQVFTAGGNVTSTSNTLGVATIHSTEILVASSRTHSSAFIRAATTTSWFSLDAEL